MAARRDPTHRIALLRAEALGLSMYSSDPNKHERLEKLARQIRRLWSKHRPGSVFTN